MFKDLDPRGVFTSIRSTTTKCSITQCFFFYGDNYVDRLNKELYV